MNSAENRFYREPPMHLEPQDRFAKELNEAAEKYLRAVGLPTSSDELIKAAKAVVWFRYYNGEDGWDKLKEAIGQLEEIVGRPRSEQEIY